MCDNPVINLEKVHFVCPSSTSCKFFGRALAKFFVAFDCGLRCRPSLYMGYHIFPGAVSALLLGSIFRKPTCYQNTSGVVELAGGGWMAANPLLHKLFKPSNVVEKLAFKVVRSFDLVVVRGTKAKKYVRELGCRSTLAIITGSVPVNKNIVLSKDKDIDIIFVGRLTDTKRPEIVVQVVSKLVKDIPHIKVAIVGTGPKEKDLLLLISKLKLGENIKLYGQINNPLEMLKCSKLFILTSRSEGMSIAMLEAMSVGAVPVVSNVGDLSDIIKNEENGFLVDGDNVDKFAKIILELINNNKLLTYVSSKAVHSSINYSGVNVITKKWESTLSLFL